MRSRLLQWAADRSGDYYVAKKKNDSAKPVTPRRSSTPRSTKTLAGVMTGPIEPIDTAPEMADAVGSGYHPNYDEIAHAAYLRYLNRGGGDGLDFDDWIAAEQELKRR